MYMHVNCKMEEIIGRINRLGISCMANESLSVTISHQRKKKMRNQFPSTMKFAEVNRLPQQHWTIVVLSNLKYAELNATLR